MHKTFLNAIKSTLNNKAKEPVDPINLGCETLTVHLYMEEIAPNNLKGEQYGIKTTIIVESIERLEARIKELKDPKNCPTITRMISEIFKEHGEEMLFGSCRAKITVTVTNSYNLPILGYTKVLIGGYEFMEEDKYAETKI